MIVCETFVLITKDVVAAEQPSKYYICKLTVAAPAG